MWIQQVVLFLMAVVVWVDTMDTPLFNGNSASGALFNGCGSLGGYKMVITIKYSNLARFNVYFVSKWATQKLFWYDLKSRISLPLLLALFLWMHQFWAFCFMSEKWLLTLEMDRRCSVPPTISCPKNIHRWHVLFFTKCSINVNVGFLRVPGCQHAYYNVKLYFLPSTQ